MASRSAEWFTALACLVGVFCLSGRLVPAHGQATEPTVTGVPLEREFDARYSAWQAYLKQHVNRYSSRFGTEPYFDNEPYRRLIALGVPALPLFSDRLRHDGLLLGAVHEIAKVYWHRHWAYPVPGQEVYTIEEFPAFPSTGDRPSNVDLWLRWWDHDRFGTSQRFAALYSEWQDLTRHGRTREAGEKWQRIRDLGIAALPCLVEKVAQGAADLVPIVSYLTDDTVKADLKPQDCVTWWEQHKQDWTLPPAATPAAKPLPEGGAGGGK